MARKPVIIRVIDRDGPGQAYPCLDGSRHLVVEVRDLDAATSVLAAQGADLLVVNLSRRQPAPSVDELRARFPALPLVVISPPEADEPALRTSLAVDLFILDTRHSRKIATVSPSAIILSQEIARALAFLNDNYSREDLSLDSVARVACMSRFHFSRKFKQETGVRYIDYLTGLRLERGLTLLLETHRTITDICFEIGYNDLTHFERMFRKWYGAVPSDVRRRSLTGGEPVRLDSAIHPRPLASAAHQS